MVYRVNLKMIMQNEHVETEKPKVTFVDGLMGRLIYILSPEQQRESTLMNIINPEGASQYSTMERELIKRAMEYEKFSDTSQPEYITRMLKDSLSELVRIENDRKMSGQLDGFREDWSDAKYVHDRFRVHNIERRRIDTMKKIRELYDTVKRNDDIAHNQTLRAVS